MKKENKKIDKTNLTEVIGSRIELKKYLGETFQAPVFITNTYAYTGEKRLVTEIKIKEYFINHAWFKTANIGKLTHGYQNMEVKVVKYKDHITDDDKYGLKYVGKKGKQFQNTGLVKPKWMK